MNALNWLKKNVYRLMLGGANANNLLERQLASGTFWLLIGSVIDRLLVLATMVILARMLGIADFGRWGLIHSTVGMFVSFGGLRLGVTATKYIAELCRIDPDRVGDIITVIYIISAIMSIFMSLVMLIGAPWFGQIILNDPLIVLPLQLSAGLLFFGLLNDVQNGILIGFESFKSLAILSAVRGVLVIIFSITGAYYYGISGTVGGYVLATAGIYLITVFLVYRQFFHWSIRLRCCHIRSELILIHHFILPLSIGGLIPSLGMWFSQSILATQTNGFVQLGIFHAARQLQLPARFLASKISQVALPMFSRLQVQGVNSEYRQFLRLNLISRVVMTTVIAIPLAILSPFLLRMYGDEFSNGSIVLIILLCVAILTSINAVQANVFQSLSLNWWNLLFNLIWMLVLLTTTWLLRDSGAIGLALALLVGYFVQNIFSGIFLRKKIRQ